MNANRTIFAPETGLDKLCELHQQHPLDNKPLSLSNLTCVHLLQGVLIYASLGLKGSTPLLLNACWTSFTIIGNTWTALYIDRFGRRKFMLIGSIGCVVSLVFLCALTAKYLNTSNIAGLRAAVFFCL
jgi:MFS family permease